MPFTLCLISPFNDPYINLAIEEFFLKNDTNGLFMLYFNKPSIIVGKHQVLLKQINAPWVWKNRIKLARRISGGGTVYQDNGNLNFSFIQATKNAEKITYSNFISPISLALRCIGIETSYSSKHDILVDTLKISGVAMHIYRNKVLCHGTLLFNSELSNLSASLHNNAQRYTDKSIDSISSKVTNISDYLSSQMSFSKFTEIIFTSVSKQLDNPLFYEINESDLTKITKLAEEKYSSWEWIFGYSPKYTFKNQIFVGNTLVPFQFSVEKGRIKDYLIENPGEKSLLKNIFEKLVGEKHDYSSIRDLLIRTRLSDLLIQNYSPDEFCSLLF